ncbi:hypothetical protein BKA65DRAFT_497119 [Rhexocercosporidium sp. MPI-PUGE-AT-0058]|nr:hypothetical protein BKA65DRAFT_497119 [Rhexocercosporidium sp. MPI-PUGE-AT-0058]
MARSIQSGLLGLADELLIQIVQHIDSSQDLCSLAVTCSQLQVFAEPALYSSILIQNGSRALKFFTSIVRMQARASFVRKLHIQYRSEDEEGVEILNLALLHLRKLKELLIEAPCCNDNPRRRADFQNQGKIDYAAYFGFASSMTLGPQPRVQIPLETLILHSHNARGPGREVFDMGKNAVIFLHPTLRNLTISCFDIGENIEPYLSASKNSTVLRSLTFDECNITIKGLAAILSVPKSLERLTIGERMHHTSHHEPLGRYPARFLEALILQERSLQYVKHIGGRTNLPHNSTNLSMATFSNVRRMELDTKSILTQILEETAPPWTPTIPSNLSLCILLPCYQFHLNDKDDVWNKPMVSMIEWLGRVSNLDIVVDFGGRNNIDYVIQSLWKGKLGPRYLHRILSLVGPGRENAQLDKRRLRIFVVRWTGFIPPYMYGEKRPEEELLFDSDAYIPVPDDNMEGCEGSEGSEGSEAPEEDNDSVDSGEDFD